jgi:hypothetical protein
MINPVMFCQAILHVILDAKFALILRNQTLELFALPSLSPPVANDAARNIILNPMSSYPWPWKIDNVSMTTRLQLSKKKSDTYDSVGILVRFGSLFPWVSEFCQISKKKELFFIETSNFPHSQSTFCISMSFVQTSSTQVPAL